MATRALATDFPLGGSHIVAMATEAELSGCQAVQVWEGMVGAGGRWKGWATVLIRFRSPPSQCCSVVLGTVASERHTSWTCRAGFLLLIEERVFWNLN